MFNKNIKLVLAFAIIAFAGYQFVQGEIGNGIFLILLSLIFVFLYFRNELILLSFLRMRKQDLEGTEKWLSKIKNPEAHTEYIFLMSYNVPAEGFRSTRLWVRNGNVKYQGQIIKLDKLLAQLGVIKTYGELMRECENSSSSNERLPSNKLSDHARDDAR